MQKGLGASGCQYNFYTTWYCLKFKLYLPAFGAFSWTLSKSRTREMHLPPGDRKYIPIVQVPVPYIVKNKSTHTLPRRNKQGKTYHTIQKQYIVYVIMYKVKQGIARTRRKDYNNIDDDNNNNSIIILLYLSRPVPNVSVCFYCKMEVGYIWIIC